MSKIAELKEWLRQQVAAISDKLNAGDYDAYDDGMRTGYNNTLDHIAALPELESPTTDDMKAVEELIAAGNECSMYCEAGMRQTPWAKALIAALPALRRYRPTEQMIREALERVSRMEGESSNGLNAFAGSAHLDKLAALLTAELPPAQQTFTQKEMDEAIANYAAKHPPYLIVGVANKLNDEEIKKLAENIRTILESPKEE